MLRKKLSGILGEGEMLWGKRVVCQYFHGIFEFYQISKSNKSRVMFVRDLTVHHLVAV